MNRLNFGTLAILLTLTSGVLAQGAPTIVFVAPQAAPRTGPQTGTSWGTALSSLHEAVETTRTAALLNPAQHYEIWVARGTYPVASSLGLPPYTLQLTRNVDLYGGFLGNESSRSQAAPASNRTIITGNLRATLPTAPPVMPTNATHVLTAAQDAGQSVIDGFVVEGGSTSGQGGGLLVNHQSASPLVSRTEFRQNTAGTAGGAIAVAAGMIELRDSSLINNTGPLGVPGAGGGGMWVGPLGSALIDNCILDGNNGSGIYLAPRDPSNPHPMVTCANTTIRNNMGGSGVTAQQSLLVTNCEFHDNIGQTGPALAAFQFNGQRVDVEIVNSHFRRNATVTGAGGALYAELLNGSMTVRGTPATPSILENNSAFRGGAAAYNSGVISFEWCHFVDNRSTNEGGALSLQEGTELKVANCIFRGNESAGTGGAINWTGSASFSPPPTTIQDSLFRDNRAAVDGGAAYSRFDNVRMEFESCTFFGNNAGRTVSGVGGGAFAADNPDTLSRITARGSIFFGNTSGPNGSYALNTTANRGRGSIAITDSYVHVPLSSGAPASASSPTNIIAPGAIPPPGFRDQGPWGLGAASPVDSAAARDLRLCPGSICVDHYVPAMSPFTRLDIDGQPRRSRAALDLGSDELFSPLGGTAQPRDLVLTSSSSRTLNGAFQQGPVCTVDNATSTTGPGTHNITIGLSSPNGSLHFATAFLGFEVNPRFPFPTNPLTNPLGVQVDLSRTTFLVPPFFPVTPILSPLGNTWSFSVPSSTLPPPGTPITVRFQAATFSNILLISDAHDWTLMR